MVRKYTYFKHFRQFYKGKNFRSGSKLAQKLLVGVRAYLESFKLIAQIAKIWCPESVDLILGFRPF